MKILWHMPTLRRHGCGLSIRAVRLAGELRRRGHETAFAVEADKTDLAGAEIEGMTVCRLTGGAPRCLHWSLQALRRRRHARSCLRQLSQDHDLFISCQPEMIEAYCNAHPARPAIFVCGGTTLLHDAADVAAQASESWTTRLACVVDRRLKHRNERRAFRKAGAVVFDSQATRERVVRTYGARPDRCFTVYGGVDADQFTPPSAAERTDARRRLNLSDDEFTVVWTGRLSPEKNVELLLGSVARAGDSVGRLFLVGDGPHRPRIETQIQALRLADRCILPGDQPDVRPYLRAADAFVFPSRGESFGGALVEAMACGLACLAVRPDGRTYRNANPEIIDPERNGLLAEPNPQAVATCLRRLSADPALRRRLGTAARAHVIKGFTWKHGGELLNRLVETMRTGAASDRAGCVRSGASVEGYAAHAPAAAGYLLR